MNKTGMTTRKSTSENKLDRLVADSHRNCEKREQGYREKSLKMYPWICGRCRREFTRANIQELTVHHRDHNHDNNPEDGGNWELLCIYCHDNEHQRHFEPNGQSTSANSGTTMPAATHSPLAGLNNLLKYK